MFSRSPAVIRFSPSIAGTTKASSGPRLLNRLLFVAFMGKKLILIPPQEGSPSQKKAQSLGHLSPIFCAKKMLVNTHVFIFPRFPLFLKYVGARVNGQSI